METSAVIETIGPPRAVIMSGFAALRAESVSPRAVAVLAGSVAGAAVMLTLICIALGVRPVDVASALGLCGGFLLIAAVLHRRRLHVARNFALAFAILLFGMFLHPAIEHLGLRFGHPLISAALVRWDAALGLDWRAYHDAIRALGPLGWVSLVAYDSFGWQVVLAPCLLAALGATSRLMQFFAAMAATLLAVDVVFLLWPADNAVTVLGASDPVPLSWSRDLANCIASRDPLYDVLANPSGLVSMPSFHTAGAMIVAWSLRRTLVFWPLLAAELLLLIGVPAWGGHYFVDIPAGFAIAAAAIVVTTGQSRSRPAPAR
jgi:hypothetical protein